MLEQTFSFLKRFLDKIITPDAIFCSTLLFIFMMSLVVIFIRLRCRNSFACLKYLEIFF